MNKMIDFADNNRTTPFFRDYAIKETQIAYRVMEYLAPDSVFPPETDKNTLELILRDKLEDAYENILNEIQLETPNSSWACEALRSNAIDLMQYLKPRYEKDIKDTKEKRKLELLKELEELDKEA
jgi:hypothetical protein